MKKIKRRTLSVLILAAVLLAGTLFYIFKYVTDGAEWAAFASNDTVYRDGVLAVGTLTDRNGTVLASVDDDGNRTFAEDSYTRQAVFHVVGDEYGNIGTGALSNFESDLIGFDLINGAYSRSGKGAELRLAIDADVNEAALEALYGRKGTVAIMNYETGEIICNVSNPSYDPEDEPYIEDGDSTWDGVYINRFLSSSFTPGSIYKLVTSAAAIEEIDDVFERTFFCEGEMTVGSDVVHCLSYHGEIGFEDALAQSCNCVFAELALELGGETMKEYAEKFGLDGAVFEIDGIETAPGNYEIAEENIDLAWSGVGQYNDTVNPCAMLRFVAAVANGGEAPEMTLKAKKASAVKKTSFERVLDASTAERLAEMMNYNVHASYGTENFPGLELYAKSGTAELGLDVSPHAWFVGFIRDDDHPYAFVVIVENGGWGSSEAGAVANYVLQAAVNDD